MKAFGLIAAVFVSNVLCASIFAAPVTLTSTNDGYRYEVTFDLTQMTPDAKEPTVSQGCWRNDECETGDVPPTPVYSLELGPIGTVKTRLVAPNGRAMERISPVQFGIYQRTAEFTYVGFRDVSDYFLVKAEGRCEISARLNVDFLVRPVIGGAYTLAQSPVNSIQEGTVEWRYSGFDCARAGVFVNTPFSKK